MAKTEIAEAFTREDDQTFEEYEASLDSDLAETARSMNIGRFEPKRKPGKYDDQVETLLRVDAETGFQNSIKILVPAGDEKKHKKWFADSARAIDHSARIVNGDLGEPQGDGGTLLEFVLTDKVIRTSKPKPDAIDEDTPVEA